MDLARCAPFSRDVHLDGRYRCKIQKDLSWIGSRSSQAVISLVLMVEVVMIDAPQLQFFHHPFLLYWSTTYTCHLLHKRFSSVWSPNLISSWHKSSCKAISSCLVVLSKRDCCLSADTLWSSVIILWAIRLYAQRKNTHQWLLRELKDCFSTLMVDRMTTTRTSAGGLSLSQWTEVVAEEFAETKWGLTRTAGVHKGRSERYSEITGRQCAATLEGCILNNPNAQ